MLSPEAAGSDDDDDKVSLDDQCWSESFPRGRMECLFLPIESVCGLLPDVCTFAVEAIIALLRCNWILGSFHHCPCIFIHHHDSLVDAHCMSLEKERKTNPLLCMY